MYKRNDSHEISDSDDEDETPPQEVEEEEDVDEEIQDGHVEEAFILEQAPSDEMFPQLETFFPVITKVRYLNTQGLG